jgi:hypothetical protein
VGLDHVRQQAAQAGDQRLEGVGRPRRRVLVPDRVDELAGEHHPVGVERQPDQQRPQPRSDHLDGLAEADPHLQRAEHADAHVTGHAGHSCRFRSGPALVHDGSMWPRTRG